MAEKLGGGKELFNINNHLVKKDKAMERRRF